MQQVTIIKKQWQTPTVEILSTVTIEHGGKNHPQIHENTGHLTPSGNSFRNVPNTAGVSFKSSAAS